MSRRTCLLVLPLVIPATMSGCIMHVTRDGPNRPVPAPAPGSTTTRVYNVRQDPARVPPHPVWRQPPASAGDPVAAPAPDRGPPDHAPAHGYRRTAPAGAEGAADTAPVVVTEDGSESTAELDGDLGADEVAGSEDVEDVEDDDKGNKPGKNNNKSKKKDKSKKKGKGKAKGKGKG